MPSVFYGLWDIDFFLGCVIIDNKPQFIGVTDMLKISTDDGEYFEKEWTLFERLEDQWHYASLERSLYENKVYRNRRRTWKASIVPSIKVCSRLFNTSSACYWKIWLTHGDSHQTHSKFDIDKRKPHWSTGRRHRASEKEFGQPYWLCHWLFHHLKKPMAQKNASPKSNRLMMLMPKK